MIIGWIALAAHCASPDRSSSVPHAERLFPRPPQPTAVVALGRLHAGSPPTEGEARLAVFLFGEEPEPPTMLLKPADVAVSADGHVILVSDSFLPALFLRRATDGAMQEWRSGERDLMPGAVSATRDGGWLVADLRTARVLTLDSEGRVRIRLAPGEMAFRPSGVAEVGDEIWCTNVAAHSIEVFDRATGAHRRTIGRRGNGSGEFAYPMGLTVTPRGEVCVADMLNFRVQVLRADGEWVRDVGRAGDCVGCFSRPKDVASGPDGTIFVTDALTGRVHAFDAEGHSLLAFGDSESGIGALVMPAGIAISRDCPIAGATLPEEYRADYYVLVAEQMLEPSIRVYAWRRPESPLVRVTPAGLPESAFRAAVTVTQDFQAKVDNPHWKADRCGACHEMAGVTVRPIAPAAVDALCVSCHDGRKARDEAHPTGRLAVTPQAMTPSDWPTVEGRIGCLTCHTIRDHCDAGAARPAHNPMLLRGYAPQRADRYCHQCHGDAAAFRFSPHIQSAADERPNEQSCLFCHERVPPIPADGRRTGDAALRVNSSQVCLTCHVRHWDVSLRGHVDRPMSPEILDWMLRQERDGGTSDATGARLTAAPAVGESSPQRLPLAEGLVTCFTCHNPHPRGLFPPDSDLGRRSTAEPDVHAALRIGQDRLCFACHSK